MTAGHRPSRFDFASHRAGRVGRAALYAGLVGLASVASLSLSMTGCKKSSAEPQGPPPRAPIHVETAVVEARPMPRWLTLTGSLVANQQSDLAADATGKVLATTVDRGSIVQKGAVLVKLDSRSAALSAREATANEAVADQNRKLADDECARSRKLLESGSISQAEFDRTSSQCKTSGLSVAAADARRMMAVKSLGDAYIRAPFSGLIAERYVSVGEYVLPQTKVATLLEIDPLRIQLTVPESSVPQVKLEQHVDFTVSAYPDQSFVGTVRYMGPALRGASRDLVVEAVVQNQDGRLRPGMFGTARLDLGESPLPVVPADSIRSDGSVRRLFVVLDKQIEERVVQVGETKGDVVAIVDGVKPGERVVIHPAETVSDGLRVE